MQIDKIAKKFKSIESKPIGVTEEYSVLLPLIKVDGEVHILYELRAKHMDRQPREISFPGGRVEKGESFSQAAIRETMEELNISSDKLEILAPLDYLVSGTGMRINCFLGRIDGIDLDRLRPNIDEVDHIFTVPLKFFLEEEPDTYLVKFERNMARDFPYNLIPNGKDYDWYEAEDKIHFYKYKDYIIWGFTAKMTKNFIDKIKK